MVCHIYFLAYSNIRWYIICVEESMMTREMSRDERIACLLKELVLESKSLELESHLDSIKESDFKDRTEMIERAFQFATQVNVTYKVPETKKKGLKQLFAWF